MMAERFDIVSFMERVDWDKDVSRGRQQLLLRLAKSRKVLNVNPPEGRATGLRDLRTRKPTLQQVTENLWHFDWGWLCPRFYRARSLDALSELLRRHVIEYLFRRLDLHSPLYVLWGFHQWEVVCRLRHRFTVYFAYDNLAELGWGHEARQAEEQIARVADMAFAVSQPLKELMLQRGFRRVYYLPNGVRHEDFERCADEPADLHVVPHPRLVLVTTYSSILDLELLVQLTQRLKSYSFVILGRFQVRDSLQPLRAQVFKSPNVYYLGTRAYDAIPPYLHHCDLALAPYRVQGASYYCSPLKVYEYLASGLPVVATPIPEVVSMGDLVYTARTVEEWSDCIKRALQEDDHVLRERRRHFAASSSWDVRADEMLRNIEAVLHEVRIGTR